MNDTPSANVYSQLQKLATQNPSCKHDIYLHIFNIQYLNDHFYIETVAQNLQRIIQEQIQTLSSGTSNEKSSSPEPLTPTSTNSNSNAQAALMILLTAQMQSQQNETQDNNSNLLQNPQVVGVLQNLVDQAANPSAPPVCPSNINEILNNPNPLPNNASSSTKSATPPIITNNLNNLLNTQNLKELLGSLDAATLPPNNPSASVSNGVIPANRTISSEANQTLFQTPPPSFRQPIYTQPLPVQQSFPPPLQYPPTPQNFLYQQPLNSYLPNPYVTRPSLLPQLQQPPALCSLPQPLMSGMLSMPPDLSQVMGVSQPMYMNGIPSTTTALTQSVLTGKRKLPNLDATYNGQYNEYWHKKTKFN